MTVIIFHVEIMSKVTIHTEVHVFSCITVSYSYFFIGFQVVSKLMLVCVTFTNCMQVRYLSCVMFSPDTCCLALAKTSTKNPANYLFCKPTSEVVTSTLEMQFLDAAIPQH